METDDWGFSAEELEFLEKDALNRIAQRNTSATSTSTGTGTGTRTGISAYSHSTPSAKPIYESNFENKVNIHMEFSSYFFFNYLFFCMLNFVISSVKYCLSSLPIASGNSTTITTQNLSADDCSKSRPKVSIKFFLHASGNIAAKFVYNDVLVGAIRKVQKAKWNANERLWLFPLSSLSEAEKIIRELTCSNIEVETLDPLLQRAIASASAVPDLRDRYDGMPDNIKSNLLPFQQEGVRFVLQHGGRVLLADEMGLGKTIQAIAVAACVRESWPVLVLTPSSLRLQWASMIQQWLAIPSSDILVVLSSYSGSNKGGFTIIRSNTKGNIRLDGLFNIVSYDAVPKLHDILMSSDFKVVIADESHFLKNAQAKRTSASLPILQVSISHLFLSKKFKFYFRRIDGLDSEFYIDTRPISSEAKETRGFNAITVVMRRPAPHLIADSPTSQTLLSTAPPPPDPPPPNPLLLHPYSLSS
ncbi:hypothetical protein SSX86_001751 [Deinandra increscens subsp. villosa]|uniref:SWI/SNF-related matrix-associated actin-dependent regulator of chromatin subfamily A-like protein 1 n=1 Tax=Deinandra increscens subsp. villosa TaxID=3103831 RepID=A0AAP0DS92_9ASTR